MTPGQAAYVVVAQRDDSLWLPWPELSDEGRAVWEAAAAAGAASAHERTAELFRQVNELHTLAVRIRSALSGAPTASIARREALELVAAADLDGALSDGEEPYPPPDEIASLDTDVMEDL